MKSLKGRLIGAATIWITVGMIAAGLLLSAIFKHHVTAQFYDELYVHLDELQRLSEVQENGIHLQRNLSDPRYDVPSSGFYWEVRKANRVLARSASLQSAALELPAGVAGDSNVHTHEVMGPTGNVLIAERAVWKSRDEPPILFVIGTDQRQLDEVLANFNSPLSWSLAAFGLSMVIAAALLILFAMAPLNQLRGALNRVRTGQERELRGDFPSEVRPLADDLNSLLNSTSELIQRARTQAGNLAHGLKTPLAILTDEADRIEAKGLPQSAAIILDQCRKMQTSIDYQIARARAVAMRSQPGTVASAKQAASDVTSALNRLHRDKGIQIENLVPEGLLLACDAQDLNEMLANLVDNACKHAKSLVRLSAEATSEGLPVRLVIEDDGPGLPAEAYQVVFNVGERWDSRAAGSGLGLAIVRDLATLYGGDVRLSASALGGLSVSLELPTVFASL